MQDRVKYRVAGLMALMLTLHFILVLIAQTEGSSAVNRIANTYSEPLFHQNWKLFVPPPGRNYRLYIRYEHNGQWSNWQDILHETVARHCKNRTGIYEPEVLLLGNSLHYLDQTLPAHDSIYSVKPEDPYFTVLYHSIRSKLARRSKYGSFDMLIVREDGSKRTSYYFRHLL